MTPQVNIKGQIMQGDSYPIPVYVTIDGQIATTENVTALRIGIGQFSHSWPKGKLTYQGGMWLFPLTQEQSYQLRAGVNEVQVQVKSGGYIVGTAVSQVYVGESLLKGKW